MPRFMCFALVVASCGARLAAALQYDPARFEANVAVALIVTERVLGAARHPQRPADVQHAWADKFSLAEAQLSAFVVSTLDTLEEMGLTRDNLRVAAQWAASGHAVTLRFNSSTSCTYLREETRDVEDRSSVTTSVGGRPVYTTRAYTKVSDYFWRYESTWGIDVFRGTGRGADDVLQMAGRRDGSVELRSATKSSPYPATLLASSLEAPATFLAAAIDASDAALTARVRINRTAPTTHTPSRNADTAAALQFAQALCVWADNVISRLSALRDVDTAAQTTGATRFDPRAWHADDIFLPSLLFEEGGGEGREPNASATEAKPTAHRGISLPRTSPTASAADQPLSPLMDLSSVNRLLDEGRASLRTRVAAVVAASPPRDGGALVTAAEATVSLACAYLRRVAVHAADGIGYIEAMLRDQVVAAVGKVVTPDDFDEYMHFHAQRLFLPAFQPRPLVFAVRRSPDHAPEGSLRINDESRGGALPQPIFTVTASSPASPGRRMVMPLSAETSLPFGGTVHVHAWLAHRFSAAMGDESDVGVKRVGRSAWKGRPPPSPRTLSLIAAARQFSCFVLLVGRITSPTTFEPASAIIVRDKDEVSIPLAVAEIPSPGEFRDAIASLSPEQARFARAFRAMQLQSTLFSVLVVHVKPQLEAVLNLDPDALTKEVELTQTLVDLFIKYQIPADLLSAPKTGDATSRLAAVKASVASMQLMFARAQEGELKQSENEATWSHFQHLVPDTFTSAVSGGYSGDIASMRLGDDDDEYDDGDDGVAGTPSTTAAAMMAPAAAARVASSDGDAGHLSSPKAAAKPPQPPQPQPPQPQPPQPQPPQPPQSHTPPPTDLNAPTPTASPPDGAAPAPRDLTRLPAELDAQYEALDVDGALRAAIISPRGAWTLRSSPALLSRAPTVTTLGVEDDARCAAGGYCVPRPGGQAAARAAAFDLLDALSRSGALPLEHAALHVVLGATHCFDESLMDTVVRGNANPIEGAERSLLIMASALHGVPAAQLVRPEAAARLAASASALFAPAAEAAAAAGAAPAAETAAAAGAARRDSEAAAHFIAVRETSL